MLSRPFAAFIKAARPPTLQATTASASLLARRTYSTPKQPRVPFPAMAAVSDQEIISRLGKLNIAAPEVLKHAPVKGGVEWRAELDKSGQKNVGLTKTLLFKPKTAKTAEPTPVLVVAKEETETSSGAIGAHLKLKDLRLAAEDLIKQVIPSAQSKDDVSALPLPSPVPSTLFVLLDSALASSSDVFALHLTSSDSTVLLKGTDVKAYLESIAASPEAIRVVDFAELKANAPAPAAKGAAAKPAAKEQPKKAAKDDDLYEMAIQHKKEEDFPGWYTDVVVKGQLIDYYDISGCYILRPASYTIWQTIQEFFDGQIKKLGVQDCYFPMFVSQARLEREKDHIEGFAPEVAWVTRAGKSDLEEHIAIRPTSETVMYPYYAKWIQSHRDLPLKLNQWNSVVRWEFKNPQPFLRTREFLWQEGHTAFLTKAEADKEVTDILDLYRQVYEDYLAVPVIPGTKSENEKFAGADYTTTVEGFIPSTGRGIQGGTSHHLGQNFSKMFEINVEDPKATQADREAGKDTKLNVFQNSWGLSTRTIGVMVMTHGDNQGLVFPPKVALTQVVVVPVGLSKGEGKNEPIYDACQKLADELTAAGIRATADLREGYTPGWKFNDWEMRGTPLRLELGPRDIAAKTTLAVRRYDNHKESYPLEGIAETVKAKLDDIQKALFDRALDKFNQSVRPVTEWKDIVPTLDAKCAVVIPWCEDPQCEDDIKERSRDEAMAGQAEDSKAPSAGAKSLCIPFDQKRFGAFPDGENQKCVQCGKKAKRWTLFGRSY